MPYRTAPASLADLDQVAQLIDDYVRQNLGMAAWPCSRELFKRDYTSGCFSMTVVYVESNLVGFAAWESTYDLHHCTHGAMVIDMYVDPAHRGRGLGPALVCAIAAQILPIGYTFLRGTGLSGRASRLYERCAVRFGTSEYNVSGQALRRLASLAGKSPREMLAGMPTVEMNYQP